MATKKSGIHIDPAHKGELHRDLGVPADQKLTVEEIESALKSSDPAIRMRARFAMNARKFKHGGNS